MIELVRPDPELERNKGMLENILRWEDDGGPVSETGNPLPQVAETNTPRRMDAAGGCLLYYEYRQNVHPLVYRFQILELGWSQTASHDHHAEQIARIEGDSS